MNHLHTGSGNWLEYLLWGGGAWATRWQCTSHDAVLAVVSILGCLWMLWGCGRYAWAAGHSIGPRGLTEHNRQLRWVFIQMAAMNAVMMMLVWVWPAYYVAALLCWINANQISKLTRAKLMELADAEVSECRRAQEKLRRVEKQLGTEVVEEIAQGTSDELLCTLIKRVNEAKDITKELGGSRKFSGV